MGMVGRTPWARLVVVWADGTELKMTLVGVGAPNLSVVDLLARLFLAVSRLGGHLRLEAVAASLQGLLELTGLLGEVGGKAEGREEAIGVEERVNPGDPVA